MQEPRLIKPKRKRHRYPLHWFVILFAVLLVGGWSWRSLLDRSNRPFSLPGYIDDAAVFQQESTRYLGKNSLSLGAQEKFQQAALSVARRDFEGAAALLEESSGQAAIPVVYSDLGLVYSHLDDTTRASRAFTQALARDPAYSPAREGLDRIGGTATSTTSPNGQEVEPNDRVGLATPVVLGNLTDGAVDRPGDEDWFRFIAPPAPRDRLKIDLACRSKTLLAALSLIDDHMALVGPPSSSHEPGGAVSATISPASGTAVYVHLAGAQGSTGAYTLVVRPLKAFDLYEPNDTISAAHPIGLGEDVKANIMDGEDIDFYSFTARSSGNLSVDLRNLSTTLVPAISLYSDDMRTRRPVPDAARPGAGVHQSFSVRENHTYYIAVESKNKTSGPYTLSVR